MTLEAGKEMDRRCVLVWLSEVYRNPTLAFNVYSDRRQIELAHDALVLLKEQEAVSPYQFEDIWKCGNCGDGVVAYEELGVSGIEEVKFDYCPTCGRRVLWEGR